MQNHNIFTLLYLLQALDINIANLIFPADTAMQKHKHANISTVFYVKMSFMLIDLLSFWWHCAYCICHMHIHKGTRALNLMFICTHIYIYMYIGYSRKSRYQNTFTRLYK